MDNFDHEQEKIVVKQRCQTYIDEIERLQTRNRELSSILREKISSISSDEKDKIIFDLKNKNISLESKFTACEEALVKERKDSILSNEVLMSGMIPMDIAKQELTREYPDIWS
jgi:hypothetical protein